MRSTLNLSSANEIFPDLGSIGNEFALANLEDKEEKEASESSLAKTLIPFINTGSVINFESSELDALTI
jgi:hypothetical protein